MELRDQDTIRRARAGDREAFRALLEELLPKVRGLLFRLGAPTDDLDDLVQEVFLTVIRRLDSFRRESRISTWVLGIAVYTLRGWRRKRSSVIQNMDAKEASAAGPTDLLVAREVSDRLREALERLSAPLREVFVLRYVEELPAAEVAGALGVPEGTVRRRAHEARAKLREWIGAEASGKERP